VRTLPSSCQSCLSIWDTSRLLTGHLHTAVAFLCLSSGAVIVVEWISALTIDAKDSVKTVEARKFACTIVRNFVARTATCGFLPFIHGMRLEIRFTDSASPSKNSKLSVARCMHYRVKSRCPECLASDSADKDLRKLPRGQGWNAKHLRDDGLLEGKDASPEADGMVGVVGVGGVASSAPKKPAPDGGIKREMGVKMGKDGAAGPWEFEKVQSQSPSLQLCWIVSGPTCLVRLTVFFYQVQLLQENQQLRAAAARADSEEQERRRQAAELEKAKQEIERYISSVGPAGVACAELLTTPFETICAWHHMS
jgi:hypothetical protein